MSATSARLRAIERSLRPARRWPEDPEVERLLDATEYESFRPWWWDAGRRLVARAEGTTPEAADALIRDAPASREFGPRLVLRAMLRHDVDWGAMSEDERWDALCTEEAVVFEREARAIFAAVDQLGLLEFRHHDLRPAMGEGAWTCDRMLRELVEMDLLVQVAGDRFGTPTYRRTRNDPPPVPHPEPAAPPPSPSRHAERSGQGQRVRVEA